MTDLSYTTDKNSICFKVDELAKIDFGTIDNSSLAEIYVRCGFSPTPLGTPLSPEEAAAKKISPKAWKVPILNEWEDDTRSPPDHRWWIKGEVPLPPGRLDWGRNKKRQIIRSRSGNPKYNIGIRTGSRYRLLIVDIDNKEGTSGLKELISTFKDGYQQLFPETLTAKTPSGGLHFYYSIPESVRIQNSASAICKHVDIRGEGGQVVAPGSCNPARECYLFSILKNPVPLPRETIDLLLSLNPKDSNLKPFKSGSKTKSKWNLDTALGSTLSDPRFQFATQPDGISNRHDVLVRVAGRLRNLLPDNGDLEKAIREFARVRGVDKNIPGHEDREPDLDRIIQDALDGFDGPTPPTRSIGEEWESRLQRNKFEVLETGELNTKLILTNDPGFDISYDEFRGEVWFDPANLGSKHFKDLRPRVWSPEDSFNTAAWLREEWDYRVSQKEISHGILAIAKHRKVYDHMKDWANECARSWDGESRIDDWLIRFGGAEDNEHNRMAGRWWLMGAINRLLNPGCKMDYALVIKSKQGMMKSSLLQALSPDSKYVLEDFKGVDVEGKKQIKGKWLVELGEMSTLKRSEAEEIKQFISTRTDRYRPSYGECDLDFPRRCAFLGTTNKDVFSTDTTGNRRWWFVKTNKMIDCDEIVKVRDLLWGEAAHRVLSGERYWPNMEEQVNIFEPVQKTLTFDDPLFGQVEDYLKGKKSVKISEIMMALGHTGSAARTLTKPVHDILQELDFERATETSHTWVRIQNVESDRNLRIVPYEEAL